MDDDWLAIELARLAVELFVSEGKMFEPPGGLPHAYGRTKAGVFVCLKRDEELRGCIGTIYPTQENVAREIIVNAIQAASQDPRFHPVRAEELTRLDFSVDVLEEPEEITDENKLDPDVYGVIVRSGGKTGLLLPKLPGIGSVEQQVSIAKRKGGIGFEADVTLFRFKVRRYS